MGTVTTQILFKSLPVTLRTSYSILLRGHCHKRGLATKYKSNPQIIRLNAENKILFGSKHRAGKKETPETENATETKAKPKRSRVNKDTEIRLEEMYLVSASQTIRCDELQTVPDEEDKISNFNPVTPKIDQDFYPVKFWEETPVPTEAQKGIENFKDEEPTISKGDLEIPKILPVPKSLPKDNVGTKKTQPVSEKELSSCFQIKEIDFVLQCPLFPDQSSEISKPELEFRDQIERLGLRTLPTVKTILSKTRPDLSNFFLQRWREKMIQELGEDGFKKHQETTIWQGVNLHACVLQFLSGTPLDDIQIPKNNQGHWTSISGVLPQVTDVEAMESSVTHPLLLYKGTFDCIAKYKDTLCVIDWKTSNKPKPLLSNLYDDPLQVVAYMGAINHSADFKTKCGVVDKAAIVVSYPNGEDAHVHVLSRALCQHYWQQWCHRLNQFWESAIAQKKQNIV